MGRHQKTRTLIETAITVLGDQHPMTVRQVYYQLVSRHVLENCRTSYQAVSNALVDARRDGTIPWDWIEDRNRRPRAVTMWSSPEDFLDSVLPLYRCPVWATQPVYVETWLEKDALSGIVQDVVAPYGITLCVGRGYDGWSSIHWAADRYRWYQARAVPVVVLYLGDFDPSGEDMVRSLRDRLAALEAYPEVRKIALTHDQIAAYALPPDYTKPSDSRRARFVAEHGDRSVELDALPVQALHTLLLDEVQGLLDLAALRAILEQEQHERRALWDRLA